MKDNGARLTRQVLERLPRESIHQSRNWSKADVFVVEWPLDSQKRVVVKDFRSRPWWFRALAARHFLRREWKALQLLQDVNGVPQPIQRPDSDAIVMTFHAGSAIRRIKRNHLFPNSIDRLASILKQAHALGVAHGDLHGDNVLVDEDGTVTVIDWATAVASQSGRRGKIFNEWRRLDERAIAKLKAHFVPQQMSASECELVLENSALYETMKRFSLCLKWARRPGSAPHQSRAERQARLSNRLQRHGHDLDKSHK